MDLENMTLPRHVAVILDGTGAGIRIIPEGYGAGALILPFGGFLTLGLLMAVMQYALRKSNEKKAKKEKEVKE